MSGQRCFILLRKDEPGAHDGYPVAVYTLDQREACKLDRDHRQSVNPNSFYYVIEGIRDDTPHDEHGNEATGVCMNCGAAMVENPNHPWCSECDSDEDDVDPAEAGGDG